jgi:translation initiation factor 6 (eIF-6)
MALKNNRYEVVTDISYFMNEVATRGGIASISTVGSGAALDQSAALVTYAANSSGATPRGLLLNDMVNLDLTRQHLNQHRDEVQMGGKVTLGIKGWWLTDKITGTPAAGDYAVLSSSGNLAPLTAANYAGTSWNKALNPIVGKFWSKLDEDGFAKVFVDL